MHARTNTHFALRKSTALTVPVSFSNKSMTADMWLVSTKLGEGQKNGKTDLTKDERWEYWRGWESSVWGVVLNGVVVRQITTYVPHICRSVSGGWGVWTQVKCAWAMRLCVQGRSCQGLIECLYMTSSCWGLGCALGKVENNERRTAAKQNRIHLYLPTAAWPCVRTASACHSHAPLHLKHGTGGKNGFGTAAGASLLLPNYKKKGTTTTTTPEEGITLI